MTTLSIPRRKRHNMPQDGNTPANPPAADPQASHAPDAANPPQDTAPEGSRTDTGGAVPATPHSVRQPPRSPHPASASDSPQNARASAAPPVRKKRAPYYPTGDGKPMAEDVLHIALMNYVIPALMYRYRLRSDIHVAGNDFLYYEEGNPKARISPDCYVTFGVQPKPIRHFYKVWEENGIAPSVVFEFTSKKTQREDVTRKRPLYEQTLGVTEYFQFDPTGDYLRPRLQGQRLVGGEYQPIELRDDRMTSEQLGLELVIEGETLRLYDPAAGEFLRTYAQAETQRVAEQQRAEQEAQRAEQEARRAESEQQRAEAAEAELSRLRQELDALRRQQ